MAKMVILDRDGVINRLTESYIISPDQWTALPGSIEAICRLKKANYLVTVASNQPGVARGLFSEDDLRQVHAKLEQQLAMRGVEIDGIFYCPHGPSDNCICRKPKPGMLLKIASQFGIKLAQTSFVGDSLKDIRAAEMAGARPALVRTGNGEHVMQDHPEAVDVPVYDDLAHFVRETLRSR